MSTRDALLVPAALELPEALREPIHGVSLGAYLFVEAARLDALPLPAVLGWIGLRERTFARAEGPWNERIADELARDGSVFDELYEDLLTRALSVWARPVDPLDREVEAWITFQRHALAAGDPGEVARRAGITTGDEVRLARLWRDRLASPDVSARAARAWSSPLSPLPRVSPAPFVFPPVQEPA